MRWTQTQADCLMNLAETGMLTPQQLQATARQAPLQPAPTDWLRMARQVLAWSGVLLLAAGVIFFFAYNWADLPRFAKLDLAIAALTGAVGVAVCCRIGSIAWRAAVSAAILCCGALLALIGQIYQTGADVWTLFASWAALSLPLALLSRSSAGWTLWWLVANAALGFGMESPWFWLFMHYSLQTNLFVLSGFNLLILVLLEGSYQRLLVVPRRYVLRLAALAGVLPLTLGACIGWWWTDEFGSMEPVFFGCAALLIWFYSCRRRDLFILAIACYAIVAVLTSVIALSMGLGNLFSWVILAFILAVMSGGVAVWLKDLHRRQSSPEKAEINKKTNTFIIHKRVVSNTAVAHNSQPEHVLQTLLALNIIDEQQIQASNARNVTPGWLNLNISLVACIVTGMILVVVGIATHFAGVITGMLGVLCLVGALIWSRSEEDVFMQQLGLAFSLSGQALLFQALTKNNYGVALPYVFSGVLAMLLTLPHTTTLHRTVCAVVTWISLERAIPLQDNLLRTLLFLSFSATAVVLWTQRPYWTKWLNGHQTSFFKAWAQAGALVNVGYTLYLVKYLLFYYHASQEYSNRTIYWPFVCGAILLFMGLCVWLTRQTPPKQRWLLLGSSALFTTIGWYYPTSLVMAALVLAAFQACQRVWFGILLLSLAIITGCRYYDASITLLNKSISMVILGAALLALRWLLMRQTAGRQA